LNAGGWVAGGTYSKSYLVEQVVVVVVEVEVVMVLVTNILLLGIKCSCGLCLFLLRRYCKRSAMGFPEKVIHTNFILNCTT